MNYVTNFKVGDDTIYVKDPDFRTFEKYHYEPMKNIVCLSDSYGSDAEDVNRKGWIKWIGEKLGKTEGVDFFRAHTPGAGFSQNSGNPGGPSHNNFTDVLNDVLEDMTAEQKNTVTDVILAGGLNDWAGQTSHIVTGITNYAYYARQAFPHAKLWFFAIGWDWDPSVRLGAWTVYNGVYMANLPAKGVLYSINITPMFNKSGFTDMTHPNANVSSEIADEIIAAVHGVSIQHNQGEPQIVRMKRLDNNTVDAGGVSLVGNNLMWSAQLVNLGPIPDVPGSINTLIKVGTFVSDRIFGFDYDNDNSKANSIFCYVSLEENANWHYFPMLGQIRYNDSTHEADLYIRHNAIVDTTDITDINQCYISFGTAMIRPTN